MNSMPATSMPLAARNASQRCFSLPSMSSMIVNLARGSSPADQCAVADGALIGRAQLEALRCVDLDGVEKPAANRTAFGRAFVLTSALPLTLSLSPQAGRGKG
jgi:hypothetical protein